MHGSRPLLQDYWGSNRSSVTANVTLYCTWRPSGLTIGLHGQGSLIQCVWLLRCRACNVVIKHTDYTVCLRRRSVCVNGP